MRTLKALENVANTAAAWLPRGPRPLPADLVYLGRFENGRQAFWPWLRSQGASTDWLPGLTILGPPGWPRYSSLSSLIEPGGSFEPDEEGIKAALRIAQEILGRLQAESDRLWAAHADLLARLKRWQAMAALSGAKAEDYDLHLIAREQLPLARSLLIGLDFRCGQAMVGRKELVFRLPAAEEEESSLLEHEVRLFWHDWTGRRQMGLMVDGQIRAEERREVAVYLADRVCLYHPALLARLLAQLEERGNRGSEPHQA